MLLGFGRPHRSYATSAITTLTNGALSMKSLSTYAIFGALAFACLGSADANAQNCKPDLSREDRISKERVEVWAQVLSETGFGAKVVGTTEVGITASVGRYGSRNAINLQIQKKEESRQKVEFESSYRSAAGKPFYFGFTSGSPLAFVVTEVSDDTRVGGLVATKAVTTVVLSAVVSDADLSAFREALTSRQIDAVRLELGGNLRIEKTVSDKNGKRMMEKFRCFYQSLDRARTEMPSVPDNPAEKPAARVSGQAGSATTAESEAAQGRYLRKAKASDFLELRPDGAFSLSQDGRSVDGTWSVQQGVLTLSPRRGGQAKGQIADGTIRDNEGGIWERVEEAKEQRSALTVEQIIQMAGAKLPDDVIITAIRSSKNKIELSPEVLIKLKGAGVSDEVIRALAK
jgi:hypothetical protein